MAQLDLDNIDLALLRRQTIALDNVLTRCNDDADSPAVTIYIEEAELLEGLWNLCAGILANSQYRVVG